MSEQSALRAAASDQDDPRRDRAFGAFIGLAVGDALGTTIEFKQRDTYDHVTDLVGGGPFRLKPGEWTDDTSMALCLADSLIAHGGTIEPDDLARRFVRWWREGENSVNGVCFDIGNATRSALANYLRTGQPVGSADPHSAGNGGLMRLSPVALAAKGETTQTIALARAQSNVTHAATECLDAAEVMARVLAAAIAGRGSRLAEGRGGSATQRPKSQIGRRGVVARKAARKYSVVRLCRRYA